MLQFRSEPDQVVSDVDVVERICEPYAEPQISRAGQESLQRAAGAHSVACEERGVRGLRPHEIVASVVSRPDDHVMLREDREGFLENRPRQMRAVAVEGYDAASVALCEVRKHRRKTCRKALTLLCHYARSLTSGMSQFVNIGRRAHDRNLYTVTLGLAIAGRSQGIFTGVALATAALAIMPIIFWYLLLQRYIIRGITLTGLKG